ncbi:hypothetical protein Droror1_Dr00000449 [Drosera rotundifolia]
MAIEAQNWNIEISKLKEKYESLRIQHRQMLGEDLERLGLKDLEALERRLEVALAQARHRKNQLLTEEMDALRRKERQLGDINKGLKMKAQSIGEGSMQGPWSFSAGATASSSDFSLQLPYHHSDGVGGSCDYELQALQTGYKPEPILEIGYHNCNAAQDEGPSSSSRGVTAAGTSSYTHGGWFL